MNREPCALPTRNDRTFDSGDDASMTDRQHIDLQIRTVVVTFRHEQVHADPGWETAFRERARAVLDALDARIVGHRDLQEALWAARVELGLMTAA